MSRQLAGLVFRVGAFTRKLHYAAWRRVLSTPTAYALSGCHDIRFAGSPVLVGCPLVKGAGRIRIGRDCVLASLRHSNPLGLSRGCILETLTNADGSTGAIVIGDRFAASGLCVISAAGVTIGDDVSIGANVTILDNDLHAVTAAARASGHEPVRRPVVIGNGVWIGMNAVILKGVKVGDEAVIAANAVVTREVPSRHLAYGNPCTVRSL